MTLSGQDRGGNESIRERFVGAWRLAWPEEQGADGKIDRADCTGLLVYTRDGHMSVQVMYRKEVEQEVKTPPCRKECDKDGAAHAIRSDQQEE